MVKLNKKILDFEVLLTGDKTVKLSDYQGQFLVLYFYPKASTPGCTTESCELSELHPNFSKENTQILGVSKDTLKRQENFKNKYEFKFDLIADTEEKLCNYFDVIKEKNMYGRKYMGIERSTFIINPEGELIKEWRKVKVKGHAQEVFEFIQSQEK